MPDLIQSAEAAIKEAEDELARLLGEIQVASRADKIPISMSVQNALQKLRIAREYLVMLEKQARL